MRNITSRDFLKIHVKNSLEKCAILTPAERMAQAEQAKRVRNFWFTATAQPLPVGAPATSIITAQTPRFSDALVLTDILSLWDFKSNDPAVSAMASRYLLQLTRFGGDDASNGKDFFGLAGPVGQEFITRHEKCYATAAIISGAFPLVFDTQSKALPLVPRLLRPYDFVEARWQINPPATVDAVEDGARMLQLGFRSVRVLSADNPYAVIAPGPRRQIETYVNATTEPETFFLEIRFPLASVPALGAPPLLVKTPQMGRPLMVLGAVTNVYGVQASLQDETSYYEFTHLDKRPLPEPPVPLYTFVPLSLWAANSDFRNVNMVNLFAVPHLLEPGAQLRVNIANGIYPYPIGSFLESAATKSSQDVRITFICRTV